MLKVLPKEQEPAAIVRRTSRSEIIDLMGSRWALRILLSLTGRQSRFSDLQQAIPGISAKVLALRLRELEAAGLVMRDHLPPPAASSIYLLSPMADELRPALDHLADWQVHLASE